MDIQKVGSFIRTLRESKGWTQIQLATMLNVTDKAVSKWESGAGLPDTVIFPLLSKIFGVSSDELLSGEKLDLNIIKTKYELAVEMTSLSAIETFLGNEDLKIPDEKGKSFVYYVVQKNKSHLIPFCLKKKLLEIDNEGIIIDSSGSRQYDNEIISIIITNYLNWRQSVSEVAKITRRKYSKDELGMLIENVKKICSANNRDFEVGYLRSYFVSGSGDEVFSNPHIVEMVDMLFMDLKVHQWAPASSVINSFADILKSRNLRFSDKLADFIYHSKLVIAQSSTLAKATFSEYGYAVYQKSVLEFGDIEQIISDLDIYEEYKRGNLDFINKVIDRKQTATELYSVKGLTQMTQNFDHVINFTSVREIVPGKETEYQIAKFFNEDYPDVVELLIRKNKGIPENRPKGTENGILSDIPATSGMSVKFIRVLFESLIEKVALLENEVEELKKKTK